MICQLQIIFFSALLIFYSTSSLVTERYYMCYQSHQSSPSSELIELPEVFSSMEKCLLHQALRPLGALEPSRPLRALLALTQHFLMHASNHPSLHQVHNQIGMTQGHCKGLHHAYKVLIPSCLLLRHCKLMLMKLEVGLPQLIGLVSDFDALAWDGHLRTHGSDHQLLIFIGSWCTQMHTVPLATATGRTRITTCGLIAQEPYKGSSKKNKNNKK